MNKKLFYGRAKLLLSPLFAFLCLAALPPARGQTPTTVLYQAFSFFGSSNNIPFYLTPPSQPAIYPAGFGVPLQTNVQPVNGAATFTALPGPYYVSWPPLNLQFVVVIPATNVTVDLWNCVSPANSITAPLTWQQAGDARYAPLGSTGFFFIQGTGVTLSTNGAAVTVSATASSGTTVTNGAGLNAATNAGVVTLSTNGVDAANLTIVSNFAVSLVAPINAASNNAATASNEAFSLVTPINNASNNAATASNEAFSLVTPINNASNNAATASNEAFSLVTPINNASNVAATASNEAFSLVTPINNASNNAATASNEAFSLVAPINNASNNAATASNEAFSLITPINNASNNAATASNEAFSLVTPINNASNNAATASNEAFSLVTPINNASNVAATASNEAFSLVIPINNASNVAATASNEAFSLVIPINNASNNAATASNEAFSLVTPINNASNNAATASNEAFSLVTPINAASNVAATASNEAFSLVTPINDASNNAATALGELPITNAYALITNFTVYHLFTGQFILSNSFGQAILTIVSNGDITLGDSTNRVLLKFAHIDGSGSNSWTISAPNGSGYTNNESGISLGDWSGKQMALSNGVGVFYGTDYRMTNQALVNAASVLTELLGDARYQAISANLGNWSQIATNILGYTNTLTTAVNNASNSAIAGAKATLGAFNGAGITNLPDSANALSDLSGWRIAKQIHANKTGEYLSKVLRFNDTIHLYFTSWSNGLTAAGTNSASVWMQQGRTWDEVAASPWTQVISTNNFSGLPTHLAYVSGRPEFYENGTFYALVFGGTHYGFENDSGMATYLLSSTDGTNWSTNGFYEPVVALTNGSFPNNFIYEGFIAHPTNQPYILGISANNGTWESTVTFTNASLNGQFIPANSGSALVLGPNSSTVIVNDAISYWQKRGGEYGVLGRIVTNIASPSFLDSWTTTDFTNFNNYQVMSVVDDTGLAKLTGNGLDGLFGPAPVFPISGELDMTADDDFQSGIYLLRPESLASPNLPAVTNAVQSTVTHSFVQDILNGANLYNVLGTNLAAGLTYTNYAAQGVGEARLTNLVIGATYAYFPTPINHALDGGFGILVSGGTNYADVGAAYIDPSGLGLAGNFSPSSSNVIFVAVQTNATFVNVEATSGSVLDQLYKVPIPTVSLSGFFSGRLYGDASGATNIPPAAIVSPGSSQLLGSTANGYGTNIALGAGLSISAGTLNVSSSAGGTVTSVAVVGDGIIDSSTPSTAVTSSGNLTLSALNAAANTLLGGPQATASAGAPAYVSNITPYSVSAVTGTITTASLSNAAAGTLVVTNAIALQALETSLLVTNTNMTIATNTFHVAISNAIGTNTILVTLPAASGNTNTYEIDNDQGLGSCVVLTNANGTDTFGGTSNYLSFTNYRATLPGSTVWAHSNGKNGYVISPYYQAAGTGTHIELPTEAVPDFGNPSTTLGVAASNTCYGFQFDTAVDKCLGHFQMKVETAVAGQFMDCAIWNLDHTIMLADTGVFSVAGTGVQTVSFSPINLPAGSYYSVWECTSTAVKFDAITMTTFSDGTVGSSTALGTVTFGNAAPGAGGMPTPTLGTITANASLNIMCGVWSR